MKVVVPERMRPHLGSLPSDMETAWYEGVDGCVASVRDAEVLWADFNVKHMESVLEAGASIHWVTTDVAGVDRWPLDLLALRRVILTNGAGLQATPISEYVVMALLAGLKGFTELAEAQRRRQWLPKPPAFGEMDHKRALIYGYGNIGRAIGERLRAFGVSVIGVRRHPTGEASVVADTEWERYLPETDLLILAVPLTGATRALVGEPELAALPRGAWVVNIARGALIDEAALIGALKSGHLGGAYLDVTETEPLPHESELWLLPTVILTPHSSWASDRLDGAAGGMFLDNLDRYRRGEPLRNVVDLQAGY